MIREVSVERRYGLAEYASLAHLAPAVAALREEARVHSPKLAGRTVFMVNSAAEGGGVAEMLPNVVGLLEELGVHTRWFVIGSDRAEFFPLTKRLHNAIHGSGDATFRPEDMALYDAVSSELAAELGQHIRRDDILVVHDPQPAGMGAKIAAGIGVRALWRCHIGDDRVTAASDAAWDFLKPYLSAYGHAIFTLAEYVPASFERFSVITPGLDPLSHKNRDLSTHKLVGVLACSGLIPEYGPLLTPPFARPVARLSPAKGDIGLLFRPIVLQISRWDRLKGFLPLLESFALLKRELPHRTARHLGRDRRSLELARLVLAGPEPGAVADDPESGGVFAELREAWRALPPELAADIEVVSLPTDSIKSNALMVNALQRCATVVVQNSLREGFGLTVTEAMWKRLAVMGSKAAGIRRQIRDGIDGVLVEDPEDRRELADGLERLLTDPRRREQSGRSAQRRAYDEFLIFTQISQWLRVLTAGA